jgi:hypothetical protein
MFLFDNEMVQSYINFATQDGTVHDLGANLLLYGPLAIVLLLAVAAYQFVALGATIAYRSVRGTVSLTRRMAGHPPVVAITAEVVAPAATQPAAPQSVAAQIITQPVARAVAKV